MRPRTPAQTVRLISLALLSILLPSALLAAPAQSSAVSQLQSKRTTLQVKIRNVRQQLRHAKTRAQQTRSRLNYVETRLRSARGQLKVASLQLERKKIELHRASLALEEARSDYAVAQEQVCDRLVASYERGDWGYLDLLLSADDVGDLLERAQVIKYIMAQDRSQLNDLKERKEKLVAYQAEVKEKTAKVAVWQQQVAVLHNRTAAERYSAARNLTARRQDLYALQAELDALERDSRGVELMLRRLQSSAAGKQRYGRVYAGPVGGLPVAGRISSGFGYRIHPIYHTRRLHTGVDIDAPYGAPIHATGGGEVIYAGWRGGYGNAVIIDHGRGRATLYAHMSSIAVGAGQTVSSRRVIGYVGSTGVSTGPHVHYEVRINGRPVNPL